MLTPLRSFLNRPIAEEFSFQNHIRLASQAGIYVFIFVSILDGAYKDIDHLAIMALLSAGVVLTVLLANVVIPKLAPAFYNEDCWTVGRHILHTLLVLFLISCSNTLILYLLNVGAPSFGRMYFMVTIIGFFPIMLGVFVSEQRRLKRNLAHAEALNERVAYRTESIPNAMVSPSMAGASELPAQLVSKPILLTSESGRERLSLQPDQFIYAESVGNYVEIHWLNLNEPQKTILRSTLKEVTEALHSYPQFFRCHRAFLVNLKAVRHTDGNARGYQLTLLGSATKVPVSRSYLDAFDERMVLV